MKKQLKKCVVEGGEETFNKHNINTMIEILNELYPDAKCTLDYSNTVELLVATQLAAQCTDNRVNAITKSLFNKYKNANDFADADIAELEQDIKGAGFFRMKARNIKESCAIIVEKYNGKVPNQLEHLLELPGVGRKTANVILGVAYKIPGIIVDTHTKRVSKRIGLTNHEEPHKVEIDLMKEIPKEHWVQFCHQLVYHGRAICKSRRPKCLQCGIRKFCNYGMDKVQHTMKK